MGQSNINLAALIGSRICHDLISPIGAINNGLELLGMSDAREGPELDLISESVGNASARIRFFRIAYGAASDQSLGRAEVVSILSDSMRGERLKVVYGPLDAQPRWAVRMAFLAVQCLETSLPYGGRIEMAHANGTWDISGHSAKQSVDAGLWGLLEGNEVDELAPAHVQFALLHEVAKDANRPLSTDIAPDRLSIRF
ncbi:histidine phosphotransferase family protein [Tateyamaria sp. ANG-S1]|uniref:histidine phosphotransferase family protein n=1 Tax=Tateyamaria sp. ANG-S1 TaxID=1577905 RepID=UPI00057DEB33|nr:histidine phosphotransferase family protein [Tateyamaria sp. ANG-S1]KIC48799.1 histidine phosphotransferase [Tateyamaria sp. ANG-S1]